VARADLADPASWPAARAGVRKVFLYAHPEGAPEFAAAARKAGVEHVVLPSSSGGRPRPPAPVRALLDIWHELSGRQLISRESACRPGLMRASLWPQRIPQVCRLTCC
jgi:hypothetical protein